MAEIININKQEGFKFSFSEGGPVYELPPLSALSFEEADLMTRLSDEKKITKQGPMVRDFILRHVPALKDLNLGDMVYYDIFNRYGLSQGKDKLGESKASRNS